MAIAVDPESGRQVKFATHFLPDANSEKEAEASRARVAQQIRRLHLEANVTDLELNGYTVLTPTQVGPRSLIERLCERVVEVSQDRSGITVDRGSGATHSSRQSPFGQVQFESSLLLEDPIFEHSLMNEPVLALITYLLGESCLLSHLSSMIKGPGDEYLPLHTDQNQSSGPAPYPSYAQVANATWALTDYTTDGGTICFVPGSHKRCRHPTPAEAVDLSQFQPVEMTAGSVVVWHGNTWHGALPRRIPGLRISLVEYFNRWYHWEYDKIGPEITTAALDRNPARFAILTGAARPVFTDATSPATKAIKTGLYG